MLLVALYPDAETRMGMILPAVFDNPVLRREMRSRMRGARAYWLLGTALLLMAAIMFAMYSTWMSSVGTVGYSGGSRVGVMFYATLSTVLSFIVVFITPALTAGGISIEREQRTIEMLEMTRLSRDAIVVGKLLSSLTFMGLLMVTTIPLMSICFMLGGVSPGQVAQLYGWLLVLSIVMGTLGLVWSSIAKTTASAVIYTYGTFFVPVMVGMVASTVGLSGGTSQTLGTLYLLVAYVAGLPVGLYGWMASSSIVSSTSVRFFGMALPMWVTPTITTVLFGALLVCLAATHLETYPERRAKLLRLLTLAVVAVPCTVLYSTLLTPHIGAYATRLIQLLPPPTLLLVPASILLLIVPVFATGDGSAVPRGEARCTWRTAVSFLLDGSLRSGPAYMLAVTAILLGAYAVTCLVTGNGAIGLRSSVMSSGAVGLLPGSSFLWASWLILTSVLAYSLLGVAISRVVQSRWTSMALLFAIQTAVVLLPQVAVALSWTSTGTFTPSILVNLAYLNPWPAIYAVTTRNAWLGRLGDCLALHDLPFAAVSLCALTLMALACFVFIRVDVDIRRRKLGSGAVRAEARQAEGATSEESSHGA